jgi:hypothetical protein
MSEPPPENSFRLLELPIEVRRMIWTEVLSGCEVFIADPEDDWERERHGWAWQPRDISGTLALGQVCRQIRNESSDLLFHNARVRKEIPCSGDFTDIPDACKQKAHELTLETMFYESIMRKTLKTNIEEYKSLQRVVLAVCSYLVDAPEPVEKDVVIKKLQEELIKCLQCSDIQSVEQKFRESFGAVQVLLDVSAHDRATHTVSVCLSDTGAISNGADLGHSTFW